MEMKFIFPFTFPAIPGADIVKSHDDNALPLIKPSQHMHFARPLTAKNRRRQASLSMPGKERDVVLA